MEYPLQIRVFLSSPGDVADERAIALRVLDQLPYDPFLRGKISLDIVAWDKPGADTPMLATMTPQEAIDQGLLKPSDCDVVIVLFWSRMGTPLLHPQYQKADGSQYLSGTEWEYWDAYLVAQKTGRPLLAVYRRTDRIPLFPDMPDFMERYVQWQHVDDFFKSFTNPDGSIRQGYNQYKTPDDFRQKFETHIRSLVLRLLEARKQVSIGPTSTPTLDLDLWQGSPFPGLRAFTTEDAPIFFGRGRETDALIKKMESSRFVAVVGASGSGKSSLVGAGLLPRLKSNAIVGSKNWLLPWYNKNMKQWEGLRFTPGEFGDNPFIALAAKLVMMIGGVVREIGGQLANQPETITKMINHVILERESVEGVLIFIDQFEEIFTLVDKKYWGAFWEILTQLANSRRVHLVITMRSDFYQQCLELPTLAKLLEDGSFPLSVPTETLLEMITRPAERAGLVFEEGLPGRIIIDTSNEPSALALMAYTLDELYYACQIGHTMTHDDYERLGGVKKSIGRRAENIFIDLNIQNINTVLQNAFRELVEVNESGIATRRRASLAKLNSFPDLSVLIKRFIDARLLVSDKSGNDTTIEVGHEALLTEWSRLKEWIEKTKDDLFLFKQLRQAVVTWDHKGRENSFLWVGDKLDEINAAIHRQEPDLTEAETDFLKRGRELIVVRPSFDYLAAQGKFDIDVLMLMPFRVEFFKIYESLRAQGMDMIIAKTDLISANNIRIDDFIWACIYRAKIIIAEVTGRNPNVLYEIGIARVLGKPIILITQDDKDMPTSLRGQYHLIYEVDKLFQLKDRLKQLIDNINQSF